MTSGQRDNARSRRSDEWKLKVFILPSANKFFIGQGDEITLVDEYPVGNSDTYATGCSGRNAVRVIWISFAPYAPINWDLHIVGSRKDDTHYAGGQNVQGERMESWW